MTNTAIVNRIENGEIYLIHIKDYGKKEKTERAFWNVKTRDFRADNPKEFNLKSGDAVEYFIPEGKTILASFTILILPILTFIISFILLSRAGIQSEKLKALFSTLFMFLSFYITKLLKKIGYKETLPSITNIVSSEKLQSIKKKCSDCGSCTACD